MFKSDAWAFGVMCYEILSDGMVPYRPGCLNAELVAQRVCDDNLRLTRPRQCPTVLWDNVVVPCFATPNARPSFRALHVALTSRVVTHAMSGLMRPPVSHVRQHPVTD